MKNNKGFVISTTLYSIFGIMLLTVFYILYLLSNNRYVLTSSIDEVKSGLEEPSKRVYLKIVYDDNQYSNICDNFSSNITCEAEKIDVYKEKYVSDYEIKDGPYYIGYPTYLIHGSYSYIECDNNGENCDVDDSPQQEEEATFMGAIDNYLLFAKPEAHTYFSSKENERYLILSVFNLTSDSKLSDIGTCDSNIIMERMNISQFVEQPLYCSLTSQNYYDDLEEIAHINEIKKFSDDEIIIKITATLFPNVECSSKVHYKKNITYYYKVSTDDLENELSQRGFINPDINELLDGSNNLPNCSNIEYSNNTSCTTLNNLDNPPEFYTSNSCTLTKSPDSISSFICDDSETSQVPYDDYDDAEKIKFYTSSIIKNKITDYIGKTYGVGGSYPILNSNSEKNFSKAYGSSVYLSSSYDLPNDSVLFKRRMYNPNGNATAAYFIINGKKIYSDKEGYVYNFDTNLSTQEKHDKYYYIILGNNIDENSDLRFTDNFYTSQNDYKKIIYLNNDTKSSEFSENLMGSTQIVTDPSIDIIADIKEKIK